MMSTDDWYHTCMAHCLISGWLALHAIYHAALAELIDNSMENESSEVKVQHEVHKSAGNMLWVTDDGRGMSPLVFSALFDIGGDIPQASQKRLGGYGRGFKSGTMACGQDVIVFTVSKPREGEPQTCSVGLLSQKLAKSKDAVVLPMVTWER
mmetsp:Transcript_19843/g.55173  ORF Transcript_19843/g.55173 Transcript_19843/m.55173 type:complete len:152 (+) Transcript_19843:3-458(+)